MVPQKKELNWDFIEASNKVCDPLSALQEIENLNSDSERLWAELQTSPCHLNIPCTFFTILACCYFDFREL